MLECCLDFPEARVNHRIPTTEMHISIMGQRQAVMYFYFDPFQLLASRHSFRHSVLASLFGGMSKFSNAMKYLVLHGSGRMYQVLQVLRLNMGGSWRRRGYNAPPYEFVWEVTWHPSCKQSRGDFGSPCPPTKQAAGGTELGGAAASWDSNFGFSPRRQHKTHVQKSLL